MKAKAKGLCWFFVSLLCHALFLMAVIMLWSKSSKNPNNALDAWLKESPEKSSQSSTKKTIIKNDFVTLELRPKAANFLGDRDQTALKETAMKNYSSQQKQATMMEKGVDDALIKPAHQGVRGRAQAQKIKNAYDPLGIKLSEDYMSQNAAHAHDYVPNVAEGDKTELNTWQWRHAPFFNRIKERIGSIWSPQKQIAHYDPQGLLLGQKDRATVLSITINQDGGLIGLDIIEYSGVSYLDEEAERAFKEAAPFLYPPRELFDHTGQFSFTFAFYVHVDRGVSFNIEW